MLVMLGAGGSEAGFFAGPAKPGSFFHDMSGAGAGVGTGLDRGGGAEAKAGCAGRAAGDAAGACGDEGALKNCVKLPSPEAASETPGEEKPLGLPEAAGEALAGIEFAAAVVAAAGLGAAPTASAGMLLGAAAACAGGGGVTPPTKIRVNSPGPLSAATGGWDGVRNTAVAP